MSDPAINIMKQSSAVHGSIHSSAGTVNRRKSIADVVVLDDTSSSSDEDFVPSSSRWKNKSKTDVGGDSNDDHSEKDEAVQFSARFKSQREHAQSAGIHVQSPAQKKSQCSEKVLDKTEAEVHKLLMMPLNEVVIPENQSSLIAALPRYAASPHFSIEKVRAVEELKKNLPSLFSDFQQMKKQQEECTRKADKKMFLTDHLTKRQELYNGL
ncbi:hypothetical protein FXO38_30193 [Capsicum annuum]|nr:hypothetical protein FXO38_30193 [Capsicum annuum]KAF3661365.1 hypothetical protein FXO37_12969 [Capsicum annuum]